MCASSTLMHFPIDEKVRINLQQELDSNVAS